MWAMNEDLPEMTTMELVREVSARLAILTELTEFPLFNRKDIQHTLERTRMLTAELSRRTDGR